ncbi:transcription factor bHLH18-like [Gastrolobium bilobum]|uniref:transcription factor bHLH18-like n=1 Tax=Gastrolobium bilobum TaxID=150636 RepID=UPI002AB17117|nr:transcription factor bHLH18-like [Gastrolobium bilobum]
MEESWENWDLHMEMDCHDDFFEECHPEDDEFFKDIILQQPAALSSESESDNSFHDSSNIVQNNSDIPTVVVAAADGGVISPPHGNMVKSNSSNSIIVSQQGSKRPRRSLSPRTYILSFDNSTMTPSTPEPCFNNNQLLGTEGTTLPSKRTLKSQKPEPKQGAIKRARSSSQTTDHIMAERKRRQELTERFIALSATIPSLNKTDKASVLRAAIDYVKQLQERVEELEIQDNNKRGVESVIFIKKPDIRGNEDNNNYSETSTSDYCNILPEIEARILGKEVLIEIHCEKENGIELKILDHLENLDLCVTGSNALPFGNFSLYMTIITQMGEEYKMTVNDLVKNLRQMLLKSPMSCDSDPY